MLLGHDKSHEEFADTDEDGAIGTFISNRVMFGKLSKQ